MGEREIFIGVVYVSKNGKQNKTSSDVAYLKYLLQCVTFLNVEGAILEQFY